MKKVVFNLVVVGLVFGGCATYDIAPKIDKKHKVLTIDDMEFNNAVELSSVHKDNSKKYMGIFKTKDTIYQTDRGRIGYFVKYTTSNRAYFYSFKDELKKDIESGKLKKCNYSKIANLEFFDCTVQNQNKFFLIQNMRSSRSSTFIKTGDKLFYHILGHFKEKAEKDGIVIKNETLGFISVFDSIKK